MLDESLPTFRLKSNRVEKHNETYLYSQHGAEFEPKYTLKHLDPEQHGSRNRYAAALTDSWNSDVLFGEVLLIPEWTQPSLSAEQIRLNGGVPPSPEPILPTEFAIQLYNPDQQVIVRHKPSKWNQAESWDFELPSQTFRAPSASALDRSQNDPSISENTRRVGLRWKKDSKLSKDLVCFQSGKALNPDGTKNKNKEPDITLAIFHAQKEITLYEPNLVRVDIEDIKGLEVVLLLGAVVLRDVYFGNMKEVFNLDGRKASTPGATPSVASTRPMLSQISTSPTPVPANPVRDPRVPPTDPRSQWEIDAETARLQKQVAEEERQRRRREEAEERRIRQMLEAEENDARRRQAEVDAETERLKRIYGSEQGRPHSQPERRHSSIPQQSQPLPPAQHYIPTSYGSYNSGPYMSGAYAQSSFLSPNPQSQGRLRNKSSIFSFGRRKSDEEGSKLSKKRSAVF